MGTVNYLQVLIADYQYQQASLGYIQAMGQRLQDTGALFVALGGAGGMRCKPPQVIHQLPDTPASAFFGNRAILANES